MPCVNFVEIYVEREINRVDQESCESNIKTCRHAEELYIYIYIYIYIKYKQDCENTNLIKKTGYNIRVKIEKNGEKISRVKIRFKILGIAAQRCLLANQSVIYVIKTDSKSK